LLPLVDRTVEVFHLLLEKPKDQKARVAGDTVPSADILLFEKSNVKQLAISKFYRTLIPHSIENDPDCGIAKKRSVVKRSSASREAYKRDKLALSLL
jgi:hypothetical protein